MRTYTKREIAYLLKVSVRTVEDHAKFLKLSPKAGQRGQNLYDQSDFSLIKQLREHCAVKPNTRDTFVPSTEVEIVEDKQIVTRLNTIPQINKFDHSLAIALEQDPLFDLELLQRISNNQWLLPSKRLAPLFGISSKQLNLHKCYSYCGFVASKEAYIGNKILWKITANNQ